MKILMMVLMVVLAGCVGEDKKDTTEDLEVVDAIEKPIFIDDLYIVAGQSNATRCDWSYFEGVTGSKVVNIARSGNAINQLIVDYNPARVDGLKPRGIIFVHGETDSSERTNTDIYNAKVEEYRVLISEQLGRDLPLYISTVGYYDKHPDIGFDTLRESVVEHSELNALWFISYEESRYFRDWDLLSDGVHYTEEGCQRMMEGFAASI